MPSPSRLGLFGVIHFDRKGKVVDELDAFLGNDPDAIFIEYPRDEIDLAMLCRLSVRVPLYLLGGAFLQLLLYTPMMLAFARDLFPTEMAAARTLARDRDLPVHPVDEHPNVQMQSAGLRLVVPIWLVLVALVVWGEPISLGVTATLGLVAGLGPMFVRRAGHRYLAIAAALAGLAATAVAFALGFLSTWLVVAGLLSFFGVVITSVETRNEAMLDRVQDLAGAEGYEDAVLVTGKAHLAGFVRLAGKRDIFVRAVHVSSWLRAGRTHEDPTDAALPEVDVTSDGDGGPPALAPGSEPGAFGTRIVAAVGDVVFATLLALLALLGIVWLGQGRLPDTVTGALGLGATGLVWLGFFALQEATRGRTLGKARFGLVVANARGGPPTTGQAVARALVLPVDLFAFGVGLFVALGTARRQRLGDLLADTVVGRAAVGEAPDCEGTADETRDRAFPGVVALGELRTSARRAAAAIVDGVAVSLVSVVPMAFVVAVVDATDVAIGSVATVFGSWFLALVGYHVAFELTVATTPGKRLFGLVVATTDGDRPDAWRIVVRNLLRPIDGVVCYGFGALSMFVTRRSRRLGDLLAGTVVGRRSARDDEKARSTDGEDEGADEPDPDQRPTATVTASS